MSYDTWGGSWGTSWGLSWTRGAPTPTEEPKTGTGGIDPPRAYKPTGLLDRKPKTRVQERVEETREIAQEVAKEARWVDAEEFLPVETMSMAQVDAEIARLLHKKLRTEDDELTLIYLLAAIV